MAKTRGTGLLMVWADIDPEYEAECVADGMKKEHHREEAAPAAVSNDALSSRR